LSNSNEAPGQGNAKPGWWGHTKAINRELRLRYVASSIFGYSSGGAKIIHRLATGVRDSLLGALRTDVHETFQESCARQRITLEMLVVIQRRLVVDWLITILTAFLCLGVFALFFFLTAQYTAQGLCAMLSVAAFVRAMVVAFRAWQVRMRRLGGLDEFIGNPALWIPTLPAEPAVRKRAP
jgi:hypothetical protein